MASNPRMRLKFRRKHDLVDKTADQFKGLVTGFYFGELGMQEHESAALLAETLQRAGFAVERGAYGFPTAFVGTFGSGAPVIAIHTEYDANPDNSRQSGVAERRPIVKGAPDHCEAHKLQAQRGRHGQRRDRRGKGDGAMRN